MQGPSSSNPDSLMSAENTLSARIRLEAKEFVKTNGEMELGERVVFTAKINNYKTKPSTDAYIDSLDLVLIGPGVYSVRERDKTLFAYRSKAKKEAIKNENDFKLMAGHWKIPGKDKKYLTFLQTRFVFTTLRNPQQTMNEVTVIVSYQGIAFFAFWCHQCPKMYKFVYLTSKYASKVKQFCYQTMLLVQRDPPDSIITLFKKDVSDAVKNAFPNEVEIVDYEAKPHKIPFLVDVASVQSTIFSLSIQVAGYGQFVMPYTEKWQDSLLEGLSKLKASPVKDFKITYHDASLQKKRNSFNVAAATERRPYDVVDEEKQAAEANKSKSLKKSSNLDAKRVSKMLEADSKITIEYIESGGPIRITPSSFHTSGVFAVLGSEDRELLTKRYGTFINKLKRAVIANLDSEGHKMDLKMVISYIPTPAVDLAQKLKVSADKPVFAFRIANLAQESYFYYYPYQGEGTTYSAQLSSFLNSLPSIDVAAKAISTILIRKYVRQNSVRQGGRGKMTSEDKKVQARVKQQRAAKAKNQNKGKKQSSRYKEERDRKGKDKVY